MAGKLTGIAVSGTHAHAFVQSYVGWQNIKDPSLDHQSVSLQETHHEIYCAI